MRILLTLLAALFCSCAPQRVTYTHTSIHWAEETFKGEDHNELNPGLIITTESGVSVGAYYNSYNRLSLIASKDYSWQVHDMLRVDAKIGAIYGYSYYELFGEGPDTPTVVPVVSPSFAVGNGDGVELFLMPGAFGVGLFSSSIFE